MTAVVAEFLGHRRGRGPRGPQPGAAAGGAAPRRPGRLAPLCGVAAAQGLDTLALGRAGEAIFVYLDELAAASAQGYLDARTECAGEQERRRLSSARPDPADPPAPAEAVAAAARAADWAVPSRVALVALGEERQSREPGPATEQRQPGADLAAPVFPGDVLIDWSRREPCLLIPDPDSDPNRGRGSRP